MSTNTFPRRLLKVGFIMAILILVSQQTGVVRAQEIAKPKLESKLVATLQAEDDGTFYGSETNQQFSLRTFSKDGKYLFVAVKEIGEAVEKNEDAGRYVYTYLRAINLETGIVSTLAKIRGDMDWFSGPVGAPGTANVKAPLSKTSGKLPWLMLQTATAAPPPKDVLQSLTAEEFQGKLVYVAYVTVAEKGGAPQWRRFLTLRRLGKTADENSVQTYPVQVRAGDVFLPQWSPNGRQMLLKVGNAGDRFNVYLIHFWNPETGELRQGPAEYVSFLMPRWSPNSQQLAYIVGGDIAGRVDRPSPIFLRVYNLRSGQSRLLATAVPTFGTLADFAWDGNKKLLYTMPPRLLPRGAPSHTPPRPSVYEVSASGGAAKLLIRDGYKAAPSPDGRWVAFFGWPDSKQVAAELKTEPRSQYYGARLHLFDRTTGQRILVQPNVFESDTNISWAPDGQHLVFLQTRYERSAAQSVASVSILSLKSP